MFQACNAITKHLLLDEHEASIVLQTRQYAIIVKLTHRENHFGTLLCSRPHGTRVLLNQS